MILWCCWSLDDWVLKIHIHFMCYLMGNKGKISFCISYSLGKDSQVEWSFIIVYKQKTRHCERPYDKIKPPLDYHNSPWARTLRNPRSNAIHCSQPHSWNPTTQKNYNLHRIISLILHTNARKNMHARNIYTLLSAPFISYKCSEVKEQTKRRKLKETRKGHLDHYWFFLRVSFVASLPVVAVEPLLLVNPSPAAGEKQKNHI